MPLELEKLVKGEPLWDEKVNDNLQAIEDYVKELEKVKASTCDVEIKGRTLKNLLGNKGNAIYKMAPVQEDLTYNNDRFVTSSVGGATGQHGIVTFLDIDVKMGKKYIFLNDVYLKDDTDPEFWFWMGDKCNYYDDRSAFRFKRDASVKYSNHVSYRVFSPNEDLSTHCSFGSYNQPVGYKLECGYARLYELTDEEFDELLNLTPDEVAAKYPYVDNVKSVINPYIESKENLLYELRFDKGSYNEFGEFTETTGQGCSLLIKLEPGVYTMSSDGEINLQMEIKEWKRTSFGTIQRKNESADSKTFMIQTPGMYHLNISNSGLSGNDLEDKIIKSLFLRKTNVVLCKGDKKKLSSDCINSRIMFETTVYEGETIKRDSNGKYIKNSEWGEINLNGNDIKITNVGIYHHRVTCIEIEVDSIGRIEHSNNIVYDDYIVKYNGDTLLSLNNSNLNSYVTDESFHWGGSAVGHKYKQLCLSLPNELTGWGDGYTPTEDEIKAFFMGWRMYGTYGTTGVDEPYWTNSISTTHKKGWLKLYCGIGNCIKTIETTEVAPYVASSNVYECPTYMNDEGYVPYKLIYRKELPTIEEISTHGELICTENSVTTHSSGLVLNREFKMFMSTYHTRGGADTSNGDNWHRVEKFLKGYDSNNLVEFKSNIYTGSGIIPCGLPTFTPLDNINKKNTLILDYIIYHPDTVLDYDFTILDNKDTLISLFKNLRESLSTKHNISIIDKKIESISKSLNNVSNPNLLINGDFKIWQRGEYFTYDGRNSNIYTCDRWAMGSLGQMEVIKDDNGVKLKVISLAEWHNFQQHILYDKNIAGKCVTFSIFIHSGAENIRNMLIAISDKNRRYSSIIGSSNLTNGMNYVTVKLPDKYDMIIPCIQLKEEVGAECVIKWAKLEVGTKPTPFVPRSEAEELADCQRYYESGLNTEVLYASKIVRDQYVCMVEMKQTKRVKGTISCKGYDGSSYHDNSYNDGAYTIHRCMTDITDSLGGFIVINSDEFDVYGNSNIGLLWSYDAEIY